MPREKVRESQPRKSKLPGLRLKKLLRRKSKQQDKKQSKRRSCRFKKQRKRLIE